MNIHKLGYENHSNQRYIYWMDLNFLGLLIVSTNFYFSSKFLGIYEFCSSEEGEEMKRKKGGKRREVRQYEDV